MSRDVLGSQTWDRQRHRSSRGHRRRVKSQELDLQFHEKALYVGAHFVWHDVESGRDFLVIHAAHQELQDLLLDLRQGLNELLRVLIVPHRTLGRRRVEPLSAKDISQHLLEDVEADILQQVRGESELECVPRR